MRRLVIGDIHGCWGELQELIAASGITDADEIISLGDAVDRGPDSARVLDFLRRRPHTRVLQGNHERKNYRWLKGELRPAFSQRITRRQLGEAPYADACAWMEALPLSIVLDEAILVHGCWEPGVALADQRATVLAGTMGGQKHLEKHYEAPWWDLYDGDRPIVVGHHDIVETGDPYVRPDRMVWGIDTSCCLGRRLTGLLLPEFELVQVEAAADHWAESRRRYAELRFDLSRGTAMTWDQIAQLARAAERPDVAPGTACAIAHLVAEVARADALLDALFAEIQRDHCATIDRLGGDWTGLSETEQGRAYARLIGDHPMKKLLHLVRRGLMTREGLRGRFASPAQVFATADRLGLAPRT